MKEYGSWTQLVSVVFRKNSNDITFRPNQATTYTASRDIQLPPGDTDHVLSSATSTQTFTNKSISGSTNTLTNISLTTAVTGVLPTANGGTGQNSTATFPTSGVVVTEAATENLTNKTLDNTNTVTVKDTLLTIQDDGDTTKQLRFQVSGVTTGTTRTMTVPDADFVAVGTTTSQVLTNKTMGSTNTLTGVTMSSITNTGTVTFPTATDTLVARTTTDTLTNKDIDGGTASNTSRITIPKNTTTNLTGLTRKQGTILYDTDLNVLKYDTGSVLNTLGTGSTATADATGTVTSFVPVVKSTVKAASADYTVLDNDGYDAVFVTTSSTDRTITLPTAADNTGREISIVKADTGTGLVLIDGEGSENVDFQTILYLFAQGQYARIKCDGTQWIVVSANIVDYAYNSSTSTTTNDTTSFAYGPAGAVIQNITTALKRRVRMKNAFRAGDHTWLEIAADGSTFIEISTYVTTTGFNTVCQGYIAFNNKEYGVGRNEVINSTDLDVTFGTYASVDTGSATFGANGLAWSSFGGSTMKWRIAKRRY